MSYTQNALTILQFPHFFLVKQNNHIVAKVIGYDTDHVVQAVIILHPF